jgi:hypothetical protein
VHPLRLARLGRTGGSGRGRFFEGGSRDDSGQDESQLGGAAEHRVVVGVQGTVVACASAATRSATFAGRIASRSLITYVAGFSRYPAARSGSRTERAESGRSLAIAPFATAGAHSLKRSAPGVIRHDALAVFGEDPPLARLSTENVEHARAGGHRERAYIDHVGDILTSRSHLGDRHTTV